MSYLVQNDIRRIVKSPSHFDRLSYFLIPITLVLLLEISGAVIPKYSVTTPHDYRASHDDKI